MKFGKDLDKATSGHEWSVYYVDYKQLKKGIKVGQRNIWEAERRSSVSVEEGANAGAGEGKAAEKIASPGSPGRVRKCLAAEGESESSGGASTVGISVTEEDLAE